MDIPKWNFSGRKPLSLEVLEKGFQLTRRPNIYDFETRGYKRLSQTGRPAETQFGKSEKTNLVLGCWERCIEKSGSGLFRNGKQITPDQLRRQVLPLWNVVLKYSAVRGQSFLTVKQYTTGSSLRLRKREQLVVPAADNLMRPIPASAVTLSQQPHTSLVGKN
ncbi:hypothetical protein T07_3930 [Trichinella nelsoni]|uniref:Uncharacterized protein n=1 Tax=Trichinella nelsoni TaxID=6336 RepID=A0A0V0RWC1_9BILA|nr:hypothetical protein T07_3930 [Trichinella nelsoni]